MSKPSKAAIPPTIENRNGLRQNGEYPPPLSWERSPDCESGAVVRLPRRLPIAASRIVARWVGSDGREQGTCPPQAAWVTLTETELVAETAPRFPDPGETDSHSPPELVLGLTVKLWAGLALFEITSDCVSTVVEPLVMEKVKAPGLTSPRVLSFR